MNYDAFQHDGFQPGAYQETAVAATTHAGLLFDRAAKPVPYRGPATGARRISDAEIAAALRKFRRRKVEEEWLLGLLTTAQWLEAA